MNTPDIDLLAELKKGNHVAYTEIYDLYYKNVARMAKVILRNDFESKDVAQDVFKSLWDNRDVIEINTSLKNYLAIAAKNKALDINRNKTHRHNYRNEQVHTLPTEEAPSKNLDNKEILRITRVILDTLCSANDGTAFELYYMQQLSYKDVAERMGTTVPNIRVYVNRALKIVRKYFKNFY